MTALALALMLAAAPPDDAVRERFARAVRQFDAESYQQALAGFEEVYAATKAPAVLFNVAMARAQLGQPIEAVEAFDALIANPGKLPPERVARAQQLRAEQEAKVARLTIAAPALEALVEIDGRSRPLVPNQEVRLNPGQRFVALLAQGHLPWREAVNLAPGAAQTVTPRLVRSDLRPAQLRVESTVSDMEVRIDGREVARTPVATAIGLAPGDHTLSLHRDGYLPISVPLDLAEGARETLKFEPQPNPASPARGQLDVVVSEPQAVIAVDGALTSPPAWVPSGPHALLVRRDGFFPVERAVVVPKDGTARVSVRLEPTPELRGTLAKSAASHRLVGFTALGIGAAIALTGGGLALGNQPSYRSIAVQHRAATTEYRNTFSEEAAREVARLNPLLTEKETINFAGFVTLGVGVAVAAVGLYALLTAPDLARFDLAPGDALAPLASVRLGVGPGSVSVSGSF